MDAGRCPGGNHPKRTEWRWTMGAAIVGISGKGPLQDTKKNEQEKCVGVSTNTCFYVCC